MPTRTDPAAIAELLRAAPVFKAMDSEQRAEVARTARSLSCRGETMLVAAGTAPQDLYHVVSGQVGLVSIAANGDEAVVALFGPGSWLTWLALFDPEPAERDWRATDKAHIIAFPVSVIQRMLAADPRLYPVVMREVAIRFRATLRVQEQQTLHNPDRRVASLLLALSGFGGGSADIPEVRITGTALARMARCSRQTLHTVLKRLRAAGMIEQAYGLIRITRRDALADFCRG